MKYLTSPILLFSTVAVLATGQQDPKQDTIRYKVVQADPASGGDLSDANNRFRTAEARIAAGTYDPAANSVLQGAERLTKAMFNVPTLRFNRSVTERVSSGPEQGDVVIGEWSFEEPFGRGSIALTDTSYYTTTVQDKPGSS